MSYFKHVKLSHYEKISQLKDANWHFGCTEEASLDIYIYKTKFKESVNGI